MNVQAESMKLFRTAVNQRAYAVARNKVPLSGMLDSWR